MMRRFFLSCLLPLLATGFAIAQNSTEAEFKKVRKLAAHREKELFSLFEKKLSREETEAMKFLYAYMPLCDLADYDGEFFLKNVRVSLNTRKFFSWGKNIPDDIFKHFVLPVRVNNESLDTARILFFREIKDRVKNLSMAEAALEVNHWCREKVT